MLGVRFVTGQLEWSITALPLEEMLALKMSAARKGDLDELRRILDSSKCTVMSVLCVFVTPTDRGVRGGGTVGGWGVETIYFGTCPITSPHLAQTVTL